MAAFDAKRKDMDSRMTQLQPETRAWLASLPTGLRPVQIPELFPRIANLIALQWGHPVECEKYFDSLLFDDRGDRQGFPFAIQLELTNLKEHILAVRALKNGIETTGHAFKMGRR